MGLVWIIKKCKMGRNEGEGMKMVRNVRKVIVSALSVFFCGLLFKG
jgi:hypothetical protein